MQAAVVEPVDQSKALDGEIVICFDHSYLQDVSLLMTPIVDLFLKRLVVRKT